MNHVSVLIRNKEQLKMVRQFPIEAIYTDNYNLAVENLDLFYQTPRDNFDNIDVNKLLVSDVGTLQKYYNKKEISIDYFLNIANHSSIEVLQKYNIKKITLSIETPFESIESLVKKALVPIEILIYGKVEVMLLKTHPIIKDGFELKDTKGNFYPIVVDEQKHIHLFSFAPINKINEIRTYNNIGINYFRLDFLDENVSQIQKILKKVFEEIK